MLDQVDLALRRDFKQMRDSKCTKNHYVVVNLTNEKKHNNIRIFKIDHFSVVIKLNKDDKTALKNTTF